MFFNRFFAGTAMVLTASLLSGAGLDDKVRGDFFAGLAGDKAALERAMTAAETAMASEPKSAGEALSWHSAGLLVESRDKFQQGDMATGVQLWERSIKERSRPRSELAHSPATAANLNKYA